MQHTFTLHDKEYLIIVAADGEVAFCRKETLVDAWNFETYDSYSAATLNDLKCAIPVFRKIRDEIVSWVRQTKPYCFHFKTDDPKKLRIYLKFINGCKDPILKDYNQTVDDNKIYFYRHQA